MGRRLTPVSIAQIRVLVSLFHAVAAVLLFLEHNKRVLGFYKWPVLAMFVVLTGVSAMFYFMVSTRNRDYCDSPSDSGRKVRILDNIHGGLFCFFSVVFICCFLGREMIGTSRLLFSDFVGASSLEVGLAIAELVVFSGLVLLFGLQALCRMLVAVAAICSEFSSPLSCEGVDLMRSARLKVCSRIERDITVSETGRGALEVSSR